MKGLREDLDNVISRAEEANVSIMQTICTKLEDLPEIIEIINKYENVYASVGVHPHDTEGSEHVTFEELLNLANSHPKIIGIGETGLDYYYEHSNRKIQKELFETHIKASQATKKPVIVHSRSADNDTIDILSSSMKEKPYPGLIHCFSSSRELAEKSLDLGLYISIAGIVTFKNATDLQESVKFIPLTRMLIETDSPYLAPIPHRGKVNEPAFVEFVARKIAEIKNISFETVAEVTTNNFRDLFGVR
jgi:TatD DNase family protein